MSKYKTLTNEHATLDQWLKGVNAILMQKIGQDSSLFTVYDGEEPYQNGLTTSEAATEWLKSFK